MGSKKKVEVKDNRDFFKVKVDLLDKAPWNVRKDDEAVQEKLTNSIREHGYIMNIVLREKDNGRYEIVNGNHRYESIKQLGYKEVWACSLGKIDEIEAERIAQDTNNLRFEDDFVLLNESLKRQVESGYSAEELALTSNLTEQEILDRVEMLDFNWDNPSGTGHGAKEGKDGEGFRKVTFNLPDEVACQLEEQVDRFKKLLHPEEKKLDKISPVMAIEAMCQHLHQTPDEQLI